MTRDELLDFAEKAVCDRAENYGLPSENFSRIASYWRAHLNSRYGSDIPLDGSSVAMMMVLLKIARLDNAPSHGDSLVDIAGYAACAAELMG